MCLGIKKSTFTKLRQYKSQSNHKYKLVCPIHLKTLKIKRQFEVNMLRSKSKHIGKEEKVYEIDEINSLIFKLFCFIKSIMLPSVNYQIGH